MKKSIFITTTVFMSCFGLAGLTLASGQDSKADKSSAVGSGMESSGMQSSGMQSSGMQSSGMATMNQQKNATSLSADQVRKLQTLLTDEGYKVGNIDGINGPITTAAIRQYQADRDLEVTGIPNEKTLRSLAPERDQQEFFGLAPEFGERQGMKSEKEGTMPAKEGSMPAKEGMMPANQDMMPANQGMMPGKEGMTPEKNMGAEPMKKGY